MWLLHHGRNILDQVKGQTKDIEVASSVCLSVSVEESVIGRGGGLCDGSFRRQNSQTKHTRSLDSLHGDSIYSVSRHAQGFPKGTMSTTGGVDE